METAEFDTPQHEKLRGLLEKEKCVRGEMSVRPCVNRAITKLLAEDKTDTYWDLQMMLDISGHDPLEPNYEKYNAQLLALSKLMGKEGLYHGESAWMKKIR